MITGRARCLCKNCNCVEDGLRRNAIRKPYLKVAIEVRVGAPPPCLPQRGCVQSTQCVRGQMKLGANWEQLAWLQMTARCVPTSPSLPARADSVADGSIHCLKNSWGGLWRSAMADGWMLCATGSALYGVSFQRGVNGPARYRGSSFHSLLQSGTKKRFFFQQY